MRLIDADALRDNLQALAYDDWNQGVTTSWADAYSEVADMVEEMPTIERKTGRWISAMDDEPVVIKDGSPDKSCHCSECGEWLVASDEYDVKGNFCPNCGADMRGREDEQADV